jgi:hypothetical protein
MNFFVATGLIESTLQHFEQVFSCWKNESEVRARFMFFIE